MVSANTKAWSLGAVAWALWVQDCSGLTSYLSRGITICIACCSWLLLYNIVLYPIFLSPLRHLPCPDQGPFHRRVWKGDPVYDTLVKWTNEIPNDGLIRYQGFFNAERILVTSSQGCKEVLQRQAYSYAKLPFALEVMSQLGPQGILVSPAARHKVDRKLLQPAFKFKYVKTLRDAGTGFLDIGERLHHVTLDIITLTAFGASIGAVDDPASSRVGHFRNILAPKSHHLKYRRLAFVLPSFIYRHLPVRARREIMMARQVTADFIRPLIQERRSGGAKQYGQGDIIATLLQSGETFTDDYLIDQSIDFMVAGQETTATAVVFTLYCMSQHPEIQSRLREEIRARLPSPSESIVVDAEMLESLPYLTAVCNEVLRLFSPVPYAHRQSAASNTAIGGVHIPRDTVVVVAPGLLHHSRKVWGPRAGEFDPERWLVRGEDGEIVSVDPLGGTGDTWAVMPFTYGPRMCIGERFARGEMLSLVAQLVGRFEWKFKGIGRNGDKPMKIVQTIVAGPAGGGVTMYAARVGGW